MKFENSTISGLNSMAMKRLLKWAILESDRFKYFTLRRNLCCSFQLNSKNIEMVSLKPKTVYMRKESDDTHFLVSLPVEYPFLNLSKVVTIRKPLETSLMLFLQRINLKIYGHMEKLQMKRKKYNLPNMEWPAVNALLYLDGNQLSDDTVCSEIFEFNGNLSFKILNESYSVCLNSPWINSLVLPKNVKSKMILHPLKFSSSYCDMDKCSFIWFKSEKSSENSKTFVNHIKDWVEIGKGYFYKVTDDEVGHYLKLECVPRNGEEVSGPTFSEIITVPVEYGECSYHYLKTHKLTEKCAGENKMRIVTYNLLAAMYTNTKEAKTLFDYCPAFAIDKTQRYSAITDELAGYNADLLCLQEVELFNFGSYLMPKLKELGYLGLISLKSQDKEGTACIFKDDKFIILGFQNYIYGQEITTNPALTSILNYVKQSEVFYQKFISLPHGIQIVALRSIEKSNEAVIVGNIHLYSSAEADLIRLLQVISSFNLFESFIKNLGPVLDNLNKTTILCGDFNSTPECSIHELITNGFLSSDHSIWESGGFTCNSWWNTEALGYPELIDTVFSEEMKGHKGLSFNLPVKMESAFGTPQFTNYTKLFKGCLDYIYYQTDRLEVDKRYPLADEDVLRENVGLPSISFPSDHLPLIVDMKWKF